jgi:hypothetical protein
LTINKKIIEYLFNFLLNFIKNASLGYLDSIFKYNRILLAPPHIKQSYKTRTSIKLKNKTIGLLIKPTVLGSKIQGNLYKRLKDPLYLIVSLNPLPKAETKFFTTIEFSFLNTVVSSFITDLPGLLTTGVSSSN